MINLYQVDNKKQLRVWSIESQGFTIIIQHGLVQGKKVRQEEAVIRGLGGRSLQEQIDSRINSRVNNQLAKGYRASISEASANTGKNEMGFHKPMLAQKITDQKSVETDGAVLQRKLDGNRMLVTKKDGIVIAYSRNGKPVINMGHVLEQLDWIEEGQTVDGEVYRHGMALKDIRGGIAKKQDSTSTLQYHIYDVVDDRPFIQRFKFNEMPWSANVVIEPWSWYEDKDQMETAFNRARQDGYEGLMMRLDGYGYQVGKRSKALLKIKHRYDAEYEVIDVETAKDGTGVLVMRLPNGGVVKGVAPGTRVEKTHVDLFPEQYIGKQCTCSYAYLTEFGVPFHLTCDSWRT